MSDQRAPVGTTGPLHGDGICEACDRDGSIIRPCAHDICRGCWDTGGADADHPGCPLCIEDGAA